MGKKEAGQHGPGKSADGAGNGAARGVAQPGPKDEQGGHGYPVSVGKAEVAVDFCTDPQSDSETKRIGHCARGGDSASSASGRPAPQRNAAPGARP